MTRALRHLGTLGLVFVLALVLAEGLLRAGALLVHGRAAAPRPSARHVVLCAGDSHTYGAGVPAVDSYPARLQAVQARIHDDAPSVLRRVTKAAATP